MGARRMLFRQILFARATRLLALIAILIVVPAAAGAGKAPDIYIGFGTESKNRTGETSTAQGPSAS